MRILSLLGAAVALVTISATATPALADSSGAGGQAHVAPSDVERLERLAHSIVDTSVARRSDVSLRAKAAAVAPCTSLTTGEVYCLGLGYRDRLPDYGALLDRPTNRPNGDLSFRRWVHRRWAMTARARSAAQRAEVGDIEASLDKAMAVEAFIDSLDTKSPLTTMDSLASQHDSAGSNPFAQRSPTEGDFRFIMGGHATKQSEINWCGPATFQMLDWADDDTKQTQGHWADDLGTTSDGTSITDMVRLTNSATHWDDAAGDYVVQSIATWSKDKFFSVHKSHIGDTTPAPVIEHPKLLKAYFGYLTHDGGGHFQVGRGYSDPTDPDLGRTIGIFEPWNERDWHSDGNVTWGAHNVGVSDMYHATLANNKFQNIGL